MSKEELKRKKNAEKVRTYYQTHPDKNKERQAYSKQWKLDNPEKVREQARKWYQNHPNYSREYYYRNREIINEKLRIWRKKRRVKLLDTGKRNQAIAIVLSSSYFPNGGKYKHA